MAASPASKFVYFIRHGQSEANQAGIFQGHDDPLTALGREQAAYVADRAKELQADVILASPMRRALETARAIEARTKAPLEVHEFLREYLPPSALIGTSTESEEGRRYVQALIAHYEEEAWQYADEDRYIDLHRRALEVLEHLVARPERTIIVVGHAGFMRVLLTAMLTDGEPDARTTARLARFLEPQNTAISLCRYDPDETQRNKWRLVIWNDHAHLADTSSAEPQED